MVSETHCPGCDAANLADSRFCGVCGAALPDATQPGEPGGATATQNTGATEQPAGFWERMLAWTVDCFLLFVAQLGILALLNGYSPADIFSDRPLPFWLDNSALFWGLSVPYEVISVGLFSTTPGKRILGLYVRQADGGKIRPQTALLRGPLITISRLAFGIGPIPVGMTATILGMFTMRFTESRPGWHNQICQTAVVERTQGKGQGLKWRGNRE